MAKALEGKIPTYRIAIEIVHQLHGKVSERLVHDCLDEKYKRKYLVDNAKKQKHRKRIANEDLAAPVPLEQQVRKAEIIVDTAGNEVAPITGHDTNYNSFDCRKGEGVVIKDGTAKLRMYRTFYKKIQR